MVIYEKCSLKKKKTKKNISCESLATDVPFQNGNDCLSILNFYLSKSSINISKYGKKKNNNNKGSDQNSPSILNRILYII